MSTQFVKDPDAVSTDYTVDWTGWLAGNTLVTSVWIVPSGITTVSDSHTTTTATIWLMGGTVGEDYDLINRVTDSTARTLDETIRISVRQTAAIPTGTQRVRDLITQSMRRINYLGQGELPTADDLSDAFVSLKALMGQWRLERLTIPYVKRTVWNLTPGKGGPSLPYTVGLGGDVACARPPLPNAISIRYQDYGVSPTLERPLIPLTQDAWQNIPQKDLTGPLPGHYYYLPTYASGLGLLYLWLVPTSPTLQGVIYAPAAVADFVTVDDVLALPDGYDHFIQENLAVHLAPELRENIPLDPEIKRSADEAKANIKRVNFQMVDLAVDPALTVRHGLRYSIFSDGL